MKGSTKIYHEHNCGVLMFVPLDIKLLFALLSLSPKMVHLTAPWGWCVVYCAEFLHNPLSTLVRYNAMWIVLDFSVCIVLHCISSRSCYVFSAGFHYIEVLHSCWWAVCWLHYIALLSIVLQYIETMKTLHYTMYYIALNCIVAWWAVC